MGALNIKGRFRDQSVTNAKHNAANPPDPTQVSRSHPSNRILKMDLPFALLALRSVLMKKQVQLPNEVITLIMLLLNDVVAECALQAALSPFTMPETVPLMLQSFAFRKTDFTADFPDSLRLGYNSAGDYFTVNREHLNGDTSYIGKCVVHKNLERSTSSDMDGWQMAYIRVSYDSQIGTLVLWFVCLLACLFVCLVGLLLLLLFVCVCLFVCLIDRLFVCMFVCLFVCMFVLFVCLYVFFCLFVCFFFLV
jgi:hypothetical protein